VQVAVEVGRGRLSLRVADDGCGIPDGGRRSGITNMRARAEKAGGECEVAPNNPRGTVVEWRVPIA
jgi:signal transduction histidine kinase